ncbi:MAG: M23 family metallopeptidase, partial [Spirochaetaceae bacterium]|nr:M23 family metallopeptidase [Spirochaetaceae bacterium]
MTSVLLDSQSGVLTGVPVCYLAPVIALPLALLSLALILNTVIGSRGIIAERFGVEMPVMTDTALLLAPETYRVVGGGEPLSIDPSAYEKIRRTEYVVQPRDTISEIAYKFGLDSGTILSMNPINDVRRLLPGTTLSIPNRDGLFHAVQPGESLSGIADTYGIEVSAILDANDVQSPVLQVGDTLFIPGASMPEQDYLLAIGELFDWPVRSFTFTSPFGMRVHPISGIWHMHTGIDLANRPGTPILAAGSGRVVHVENQASNFGKMIIIDHDNEYRTLYAHLDTFGVS